MKELDVIKELDNDLQVNTATTPVFLNEEEIKSSITLQGKSVNLVSRSVTIRYFNKHNSHWIIDKYATFNEPKSVTIKTDPSTL